MRYVFFFSQKPFPEEELPEFQIAFQDLFEFLTPLHNRVLEIIGMGLKLEASVRFLYKKT